ncbi:MAG: transglycosylase SLT domain-containing protein [Deltaproteobacteria bacterium]|nr:transglycosylase SLT domain-containing protein [Deltaproteobacteria bacterium]
MARKKATSACRLPITIEDMVKATVISLDQASPPFHVSLDGVEDPQDHSKLDEALHDESSPGVLDTTELAREPSLRAFCSLREDPPLMQRARYLAGNPGEFLEYVQNRNVLENLPPNAIEELQELAQKMGGVGLAELEAFKNSPRAPFVACPEKYITDYKPVSEPLYVIPGLEKLIAYWRAVDFGSDGTVVFAGRDSKEGISTTDFFPTDPFDIRALRLARVTFQKNVDARLAELNKAVPKNGERFLRKRGEYPSIYRGAILYSEWQPHLEKKFTDRGLPAHLAKIAIVESRMSIYDRSNDNAVGPYQFKEAIGKHYGLRIDAEIDERLNPVFAAEAAARLLQEAKRGILSEGFVPDTHFDDRLADILSTSAYHAGIDNLRTALREAKLKAQNPSQPVTPEMIAAYPFASPLRIKKFRDDSKDYPPQLYPAVEAVDRLPSEMRLPVRKLVTVSLNLKQNVEIPLFEMLAQLSYRDFININSQYDWDGSRTGNPIDTMTLKMAENPKHQTRFLLLEADVSRLKSWLIQNGYVTEDQIKIS